MTSIPMIEIVMKNGSVIRLAPRHTDKSVSLIDVAKIVYALGPVAYWHPLEPVSASQCSFIRYVCNHTRVAVANVCGAYEPLPWQWFTIVDEGLRLGVAYRMEQS